MRTPRHDQFVHDIKGLVKYPYYMNHAYTRDIALYMCIVDQVDIVALIQSLMIEMFDLEQQLHRVRKQLNEVTNSISSEPASI